MGVAALDGWPADCPLCLHIPAEEQKKKPSALASQQRGCDAAENLRWHAESFASFGPQEEDNCFGPDG